MSYNNKINDKTYIPLPPFKGWVLENFPFIESDFDCITNYQLLCKITEYLNNVISNQNQVQELGTELVNGYNNLLDYVNNYFDNLDVQDEINNKLDSMVEDGTLQEIITSYIDSNVTWTFDSINDMKQANNLIAGSFAKTIGYYTPDDGGNGYYLIVDDNTLIDDGGSIIDVSNNLKAVLLFEKDYINVKQFGAKGNNVDDDYLAFTNCINKANETMKNIYIPSGEYIIENDLPSIKSGIQLIGDSTSLRTHHGTIINDYRTTKTFLIKFINDANKDLGGGIKDISFISQINTIGLSCISLDSANGWTGVIQNVRIANYKGTAIYSKSNDYRYENCIIHHCSIKENDNIYYAIELGTGCNENKFIGCHIEHCRYVLKTSGSNFLNGFYHCKVEMSTINMNLGEYAPPISITSTNPMTSFTFNACDFINLDIEAYIKQNSSVNYNSVPAMITSTQGLINIVGNNFTCGQGSGSDTFAQSSQSRYINIVNGIIDSNIFYAPSYIVPSINSNLCTLNGNMFYPLEGGTYVGVRPAIPCVVDNNYTTATLGSNNRFFVNTSIENFITPYRFYDKYTFRSGGTQPRYSYNIPVKPNIVENVNNYLTLVLKPVQSYAQLFAGLNIHVATFERNRFLGTFTLKAIETQSNHLLSLLDDSQLYKEENAGNIYCCIKNRCVYVQIPVVNDGTILITADGFEGQYYMAYVDRNINELITDYDWQTQVVV